MSYMETIKRLNESVKNNTEMTEQEKERAKKLLSELANILALY